MKAQVAESKYQEGCGDCDKTKVGELETEMWGKGMIKNFIQTVNPLVTVWLEIFILPFPFSDSTHPNAP